MAAPDIFLSYNREDQAVAKRFAEGFEAAGLSVWWDVTLRSGEAYDAVTEDALRTAKAVVVLWSPRSAVSRWVRAEASIADENGTLVPAKIEACDLPVMFRLTQTADLSHWLGDAGDPDWQAFLGDVQGKTRSAGAAAPKGAVPDSHTAGNGAGPPCIAVLPLALRASDPELEFLAEDLTEEITREMALNRFFEVIAAGTLAPWRGKAIDYRQIGRDLGVRHVLEGKLQRAGDDLRLTMQIVDAASGKVTKSVRFVRKLAAVTASLEEFAASIGTELGEQVVQIEAALALKKAEPLSAWDYIFRTMAARSRAGSRPILKAIEEARCAVAAAPNLGLAHALLASALGIKMMNDGKGPDAESGQEILSHAQRAMELDADNPTVIGLLYPTYTAIEDTETSLRLARRAAELSPNSPLSHFGLGVALSRAGRFHEAIAAFREQDRLTPFDGQRAQGLTVLAVVLYLQGQEAEAEIEIERALALRPNFDFALIWKAIMAARRGEEAVALAAIRSLRETEPDSTFDRHGRLLSLDKTPESIAILRRLWEATGGDP